MIGLFRGKFPERSSRARKAPILKRYHRNAGFRSERVQFFSPIDGRKYSPQRDRRSRDATARESPDDLPHVRDVVSARRSLARILMPRSINVKSRRLARRARSRFWTRRRNIWARVEIDRSKRVYVTAFPLQSPS